MFETQARVHRPKREGAGGDADRPETSIRPHCHYERNINHTASQHDGNVYLDTPPAGCSGWKGSSPGKEAQEEEETETEAEARKAGDMENRRAAADGESEEGSGS